MAHDLLVSGHVWKLLLMDNRRPALRHQERKSGVVIATDEPCDGDQHLVGPHVIWRNGVGDVPLQVLEDMPPATVNPERRRGSLEPDRPEMSKK